MHLNVEKRKIHHVDIRILLLKKKFQALVENFFV